MIKKLYVISFILPLFFTDVLFCMTKSSEDVSAETPLISREEKEEAKTSLSSEIYIEIRQALRAFTLDAALVSFQFFAMNEGYVDIDPVKKIVCLNEPDIRKSEQITWTAYYIAAYIHYVTSAPLVFNLEIVFHATCARLLHYGRHDVLLNRIAYLVAMIVGTDTPISQVPELGIIIANLDRIGYSSNFTISDLGQNLCVLTSMIEDRHSSFTMKKEQITNLSQPYSVYKERFIPIKNMETTCCDCIIL